jgi:hypothetical protein
MQNNLMSRAQASKPTLVSLLLSLNPPKCPQETVIDVANHPSCHRKYKAKLGILR